MRSSSILGGVALVATVLASSGFAGSDRHRPADASGFDGSGRPAHVVALWHEGATQSQGGLRRVACATQGSGDRSACFVAVR